MERYTRKDIDQEGYEIKGCGCQGDYMPITDNEPDMIDKLGQIEDIEEELGIDLITLFRALQYGIYGKSGNIVYPYNVLLVEKKLCAYPLDIWEESWDLVDYGKTWALTKEELI